MGQGKAISEAVQWIVIHLSPVMTPKEIAMYTDVGERSVKRILSYFRQTGEVKDAKKARPQVHRHSVIVIFRCALISLPQYTVTADLMQLQYMLTALNNAPDLYLDKLCTELHEECGTVVSESTIWRTLIQGGYTIKKVGHLYPCVSSYDAES
jgi:transposase